MSTLGHESHRRSKVVDEIHEGHPGSNRMKKRMSGGRALMGTWNSVSVSVYCVNVTTRHRRDQ